MPLVGVGRFLQYVPQRSIIYVSQALESDSGFPFEHGDDLLLRLDVENQQLIIRKADQQTLDQIVDWNDIRVFSK